MAVTHMEHLNLDERIELHRGPDLQARARACPLYAQCRRRGWVALVFADQQLQLASMAVAPSPPYIESKEKWLLGNACRFFLMISSPCCQTSDWCMECSDCSHDRYQEYL